MRTDKKRDLLKRRRWRIRKKVRGTVERPRMSVRMSNKNIYVQFIDDEAGHTLASVSSKAKSVENRENSRPTWTAPRRLANSRRGGQGGRV